ncbi:MAG: hypothetical protein ACK56I_10415, partial [bacterium]
MQTRLAADVGRSTEYRHFVTPRRRNPCRFHAGGPRADDGDFLGCRRTLGLPVDLIVAADARIVVA